MHKTSPDLYSQTISSRISGNDFLLFSALTGDHQWNLCLFDNTGLSSLSLPSLTGNITDLSIYSNSDLSSILFGSLSSLDSITIHSNHALQSIAFSVLQSATDRIQIYNNTLLNSRSHFASKHQPDHQQQPHAHEHEFRWHHPVGSSSSLKELYIHDNDSLISFSMNNLSILDGDFIVSENDAFNSIFRSLNHHRACKHKP